MEPCHRRPWGSMCNGHWGFALDNDLNRIMLWEEYYQVLYETNRGREIEGREKSQDAIPGCHKQE